ncbi:MAG: pyridoxal-dependent decarboxylase, exosortase A system-associated [Rhodocyclaceae bacterium]|nr:pyridoxal-dependent decarboxylase, exosortase A system-associated [Rhodocyclaceae bacterium]
MNAPAHGRIASFAVSGNELTVGGIPLTRLAARVGRTPFYAYERASLDTRVAALRASLPQQISLHYAIKANPMPALVCHMARLVDGLDVASGQELRVALDSGMDPAEISFAGPGKTPQELAQAVAAGILVNCESMREIELLAQIAGETGLSPRIALRVNPDFELKSSGMKMGGGPKQFGIDAESIPQALARLRELRLACEGFHIFSGSQNLRPQAIVEAQQKAYALAMRLAEQGAVDIRVLNLGGGFGIPYFPGEQPLDLAPIGENLATLVERARQDMPRAELVVELGRFLVGEAGIYVCRVIDRKVSRGQVYLVTDGGLHHHLSASGNFGQVIRKNYPAAIGTRMQSEQHEQVSVVGPLCTPLDLLADRMDLPAASEGDLVVIFQSGAYGASASPQGFLSHPTVLEVLV